MQTLIEIQTSRSYFATPIESREEAHAFLRQLDAEGLLFHPEDSPSSIVDDQGRSLFEKPEADLLVLRMNEVYAFDNDPCAFILDKLSPVN